METEKSKVYIKIDSLNRIIQCEGGYTTGNIDNIEEWILIDEGIGDKFNLCQSHYFDGGLYTDDGIPRYKFESGTISLRTDGEIESERESATVTQPSMAERVAILEGDSAVLKEALDMILNGVIE